MYRRATEPDQAVDLHQLLNEVAQDYYGTHPDTECSVDGIDGPRVLANNWILRQAFHNLVDNSRRACEHRGVGFGKVRMTIDIIDSPLAGRCCRVDIEDDGIGLSADAAANIQTGARVSRWGGRGIGIRTARSWFEEYGGSLEIMPSTGRLGGAHVRVVLPVLPDDAPE
jgi:nitrogen fixation/metabolism regulation signal transduction histidine kinase